MGLPSFWHEQFCCFKVVNILAKYKDIFVEEKLTTEKGVLPPDQSEKPWKRGLITFAAFILFGGGPSPILHNPHPLHKEWISEIRWCLPTFSPRRRPARPGQGENRQTELPHLRRGHSRQWGWGSCIGIPHRLVTSKCCWSWRLKTVFNHFSLKWFISVFFILFDTVEINDRIA